MRIRINDDQQQQQRIEPDAAPAGTAMGASAAEFLEAADEAIARVLSGDAESFLRANKQQGGE